MLKTVPLAKKVSVLGAAGGIGQPLSLLLKSSQFIETLSLYDLAKSTPGVAVDLSHVDTPTKVVGYCGDDLGKALADSDVVVVPAGVPRKPNMTRDDLFNTNATIVHNLAVAIAKYCPKAYTLVISNPVNSTVPICAEAFKRAGCYNPKRLFGITTLDVVRARTFVAAAKGLKVLSTNVTVVGGHAGITILPLLSQTGLKFSDEEVKSLTHRIQFGGDEVVAAKDGAGSATLSMAHAGARFTNRLLSALAGEKDVVECTFVESTVTPAPFFSSRVTLGKEGVEKIHPLGPLSVFEQTGFDAMMPELQAQIAKGQKFKPAA